MHAPAIIKHQDAQNMGFGAEEPFIKLDERQPLHPSCGSLASICCARNSRTRMIGVKRLGTPDPEGAAFSREH
jgi:hypothetical protein